MIQNDINFSLLEKCLIITKTYKLCYVIKLSELTKSKHHQYPSPMMDNGDNWSICMLNVVCTWSYTKH
jgi:hypothetical protein